MVPSREADIKSRGAKKPALSRVTGKSRILTSSTESKHDGVTATAPRAVLAGMAADDDKSKGSIWVYRGS